MAQDAATLLALSDMEGAGVDMVTDGEIRRESYSNRFANALDGLDLDNPGSALDRTGHPNPVPRVVGPIRRTRPVQVRDVEFLRAATDRPIRITVPGPFTMAQQAQNDHYADEELRCHGLRGRGQRGAARPRRRRRRRGADRRAVPAGPAGPGARVRAAGAEPRPRGDRRPRPPCTRASATRDRRQPRPGYAFLAELDGCPADQISVEAAQPKLDAAVLEALPSKQIIFGVLDLGDPEVETPEVVADRIWVALEHVPPERLVLAPDCGMKYLPRAVARGKLAAMVAGDHPRSRAALGVAAP